MPDLYEKLRDKLDSMSTGYPKVKSGRELKILKTIFTDNEASLYLNMTIMPESPKQAGLRLGMDEKLLESSLETMAKKGLLFRIKPKDGKDNLYSIVPYLVGIMEFQVKRLEQDTGLAKEMAIYGLEGFIESLQSLDTPHQRTVPVNKELVTKWPIAPFDDAVSIIEKQKRIAVAPCVCRTLTKRLGVYKCEKPIETCMMFGIGADYYVDNKFGRYISLDEAYSILKQSDETGLVIQPLNAKKAGAICSCCGDCCGMMMSLKMQPNPSHMTKSSYYAKLETEECIGCGICLKRCQMEAIKIEDKKAIIDLNRCIGCGLCVTKCPTKSVYLVKKDEKDLYDPPEDHMQMYIKMAKERGLFKKR
jgi:ferredoxin